MIYPFLWQWQRARYPQAWLCTRPTEKAVQSQILQLLNLRGIKAFPVDAGAKAIRGRATGALQRAGMRDAARYVNFGQAGAAEKGVSDVIGTLPGGRSLYIEVKQPEWLTMNRKTGALVQYRGANKPTDDQLKFLLDMHQQGALVTVAWATEDVEALLKKGAADGSAQGLDRAVYRDR